MNNNLKRYSIAGLFLTLALLMFAESGIFVCGHFRRNRTIKHQCDYA